MKPRQKTTQTHEDSSTPYSSYISFPPFQDTPLLPGTPRPSKNPPPNTSSSPPSSSSSNIKPSTPPHIVSDPTYYDRFAACVYFRDCGGWVAVPGTACAACVRGKAGGVLDRLREASRSGG